MTEGFSRSVALPYLDTKNYLILFLLWPFLACITAILNFGQKEARNIVYAFLVYYGLTFVVGNEGIDASRIAMALKMNAMLPFSDIFRIIGGTNSVQFRFEPRIFLSQGIVFGFQCMVFFQKIMIIHGIYPMPFATCFR